MEKRYVEGIGLACRPGRNTIKMDIRRAVVHGLVRLSYITMLPARWRSYLVWWAWNSMPLVGASKGNTWENDILKLLFNATAIANVADNAASSPLTHLQVSLHTGDPGEAGTQQTSEAAYTNYTRTAVVRSGSGWTVTNNTVNPAANIDFPESGSSETITHFGVGSASSGAGKLFYKGAISPTLNVVSGFIPRLGTGTAITED